ncbi:carbohydrate kinase family protein [Clostridium lacusfryxellense]|uniref:carbohydrate kinase family protein n=1 Tax=Clostridium lacusfryxellense TaxID=205328 RepID=UPI001C0BBA90|nr:carbohydrate kinase [Clostridium lacusfryxellense]MBU3113083.1 carbohydrate kinase [Clostridium lacusfryxellense]
MSNIFTIGEALIDFIPEQKGVGLKDVVSFEKAAGGAPANVAACAAILGAQSYFIGKLGRDAFGDFLVDVLRNVGVNTGYIQRTDKANTALAFVSLSENGDRDFSFYRSPSADMLLDEKEINSKWFNLGDILHFCSVSLIDAPVRKAHIAAIKAVKEVGGIISFDPNIRLPLWKDHNEYKKVICDFIEYADILKISEDEIEFITGEKDEALAIEWLLSFKIKILIITRGHNGVSAYYNNQVMRVPGYSVSVVDTTGAGDAFIGSFIYKISTSNHGISCITNENMKEILSFSNAVAALTTTRKGAINAIPSREVVEKFRTKF